MCFMFIGLVVKLLCFKKEWKSRNGKTIILKVGWVTCASLSFYLEIHWHLSNTGDFRKKKKNKRRDWS